MSIPRLSIVATDANAIVAHAQAINGLIDGKADVAKTFTLTAGATSTVVSDNKFESGMVPVWVPMTAHAATAMTSVYLSARASGSFTLTHNNTADVDRTFGYVRLS